MENSQMQGGYLMGNSHANGGIKIKTPEGQIEAEGGEVIINKRVMALDEKFVCEGTPREITSKVNEMEGGVSWSETGSCRIMKKAEDGSEIEEEITLSDDGFGVLYVSGGKNYIVTADTKDQAEIIEQSIKDFKDGFITKDELENTLQSYMNDDHELAGEVQTIGGKPYVYNDFYAGYIPVMDAEAHNIDYSSELGDGGSIYGDTLIKANGVNLEDTNVKGQLSLMNIEYERIRGDYKIGNIDENEYYQYKKEIVNKYLPFIKKGKELGVPVNMGLLHNTNLTLSNGGATTETASQGSILRSSNPEKRPSPSVSATIYPAGFQMEGNDGNTWEIALDSRGIHRWKKVKGEDGLDIAEENAFRHDPMEIKFKKEPIVQWDGKAFAEAQLKAIKERRQSAVLYCDDTNGVPSEDKLRTLSEDEDYRIDVDAMNALYSYEFYKNGNLVCIPQIEVFNYEYTQEGGSGYRNMYDEYRGAFYTKSEPKPVSFIPTDYSVYTEGCNLSDEDTALLEEHARIIFNKFLKDVDITESSAFIITKDKLNAALKEGTELAANGKKVTKASLLKTVSDKDEYWFTPEGRISSEKKGTANEFIQHEWAKMFGANNMKLVGGNDKEYVYELEGNPMMIAAATSYLQEEKGVEIETYGRKKRVHIPKKVIDSTSAHLRYPLITPFANGGGLGKKIESLEKEKKKLIEEWKIATGAEKDKLYKKWQDVGIDLSYAQRDMYRDQEIEERNKMTIDFMKALEEGGIMTPGSHKDKAAVDSIKSIISMDGYEFSKYIKKVKDRKIDGIYREFQDWKQTYHKASKGTRVDKPGESFGKMVDRISNEMADKYKDDDWGDDYETLFKAFLAKKHPSITYTDYQNLPKKQHEKITNEYIDYTFANNPSLGRGIRFDNGGGIGNQGLLNKNYLDSIPAEKKAFILKGIAEHYGISVERVLEEVTNNDAEELADYIPGRGALEVFNAMRTNKMANGGGVDGLPENYYQHAISRDNRIYTGDSYIDIISQQSPNFFHKDISFMGYVDKLGEFYDVQVDNKYANGGGIGNGYMVFNYTDNLYASNDIFATKKEANNFISQFRKRFEQQGYYRDSNMNKIDIDDIDLLVIDESFNPFRYAEGGGVPQAKYGRRFGSGFSGRTNREEYLGNGVWGDDEGNRWDKNGKTISGYGKSGKTKEEEYEEKYGKKTSTTENDKLSKANLIASRIAAKKGQPVTEKLVQWVLKQMDEGKFAADGKQIEQADILTNSMLSILDLFSYISMRGNKIVIQGSTYTYSSHGKYNLRVTGGKGATYNIVPYFPEKHGKFVDANFYSLIRQKVNEHFAITKEGELIDVAENGTEIKS